MVLVWMWWSRASECWTGLLAKKKSIPRRTTQKVGDQVAQSKLERLTSTKGRAISKLQKGGFEDDEMKSNHSTRRVDSQAMAALNGEDWEAGGSKQSSMLASSISLRTQAHERLHDARSNKWSPETRRPGEEKKRPVIGVRRKQPPIRLTSRTSHEFNLLKLELTTSVSSS